MEEKEKCLFDQEFPRKWIDVEFRDKTKECIFEVPTKQSSSIASPEHEFSVFQFNVLAQGLTAIFSLSNHELKRIDPKMLSFERRVALICELINTYNYPSVLTFQEMDFLPFEGQSLEKEVVSNYFVEFLTSNGYEYVFERKKGDRPNIDGCMIAWKKKEFSQISKLRIDIPDRTFFSPISNEESSPPVKNYSQFALLVTLESKISSSPSELNIVTTHLKADEPPGSNLDCEKIRTNQIEEIMNYCMKTTTILTGDMNTYYNYQSNCGIGALQVLTKVYGFQDIHSHFQKNEKACTYTFFKPNVLDYIFLSQKSSTIIIPKQVLDLPENYNPEKDPSFLKLGFPSDHLPLIAKFAFPKRVFMKHQEDNNSKTTIDSLFS